MSESPGLETLEEYFVSDEDIIAIETPIPGVLGEVRYELRPQASTEV